MKSRLVAAATLMLISSLSGTVFAQQPAVEIMIRTFVPDPANAGTATANIVANPMGGSLVRLRGKDGAWLNECFATDHRGFNSGGGTARVETKFTMTLANGSGTVTPASGRTKAGVTKKVQCDSGRVLEERAGMVNRDNLGAPAVASGIVQVVGQVEGTNALTFAGPWAPAIDYSFDLQWQPSASVLTAAVTYGVFPAFEMYARRPGGSWVTVFQRKPTGIPARLAGDSFGINSTREVGKTTIPER